jgi:hypothetical protein
MVWLPYQVLGTISMLFIALVEMRLADQVRDADIKLLAQAFAIAIAGVLTVGWVLIGRNASVQEFRLFAYLLAFLNALAAIGWPVTIPLFYRHLAAILRQAEAD